MKRLLELIQSKYCLLGVVYLAFMIPLTAQYSTVSYNYPSSNTPAISNQSQQVFKKIQIKSKNLRKVISTSTQSSAKKELELYYITTLALKISGGISLERAVESNYHDLIGHARLVGNTTDLDKLVSDILTYLR